MTHFYINNSTPPQYIAGNSGEIHNAGPEPADFAPINGDPSQVVPARGRLQTTSPGWLSGSNAHITITSPGGR